ncbi:Hypothetical protein D9617_14g077000 [Elsinoe fawcettii]|nr:Hypothetical protein D9617_14g077000 [Elsinoe fawcettii]
MVLRRVFHTAEDTDKDVTQDQSSTSRHHDGDAIEQDNSDWPHRPDDSLPSITQEAISVLLLSSSDSNGEINGLGYWQTANAYTAIALHDIWSHQGTNIPFLQTQLSKILNNHKHCINEFNDDTLWYTQLLLHLYTATSDPRYLSVCLSIHAHVTHYILPPSSHDARGRAVSGAVLWKSGPCREVNSITTALWAEFCAHLAVLCPLDLKHDTLPSLPSSASLLAQAQQSITFIFSTLYRRADQVVLDTLRLDTGEVVDWTFTYTTAQTIAACVALHSAVAALPDVFLEAPSPDHDSEGKETQQRRADALLILALRMLSAALRRPGWVQQPGENEEGVLTEYSAYGPANHPDARNDDAVGFKSVLVRTVGKVYSYLCTLLLETTEVHGMSLQEMASLREELKVFVRRTYQSISRNNVNDIGQYGPWWAGPSAPSTGHSQMAVLDVMACMKLMNHDFA